MDKFTVAGAGGTAQRVSGSSLGSVIDGLRPYASAGHARLDLDKTYGTEMGGTTVIAAWKLKDAGGLAAWSDAAVMGPIFEWAARVNGGDGGDYLGRALAQNADASLWLQALVKAGVIKQPSPEWRRAIEVASMTIDIGDDGAGRTGYNYVLTGVDGYPGSIANKAPSVKMPEGLHARAAALVGGTGGGGFHAETAYDSRSNVPAFTKRLIAEAKDMPNLLRRVVDRGQIDREIASLNSGSIVATAADREAFADALVAVKLADRSRGKALRIVVGAGGLEAGIAALMKDGDFTRIVENYTSHKKTPSQGA